MKHTLFMFVLFGTLFLASCGDEQNPTEQGSGSHENQGSGHHSHSSSGEVPENLKIEENPTYPVGTKAKITANHMEGMEGAEATIVGAYNTVAYIVSYTPTTGGDRVTNHKWVIHEEIDRAPEMPIEPNSEVSLNADHMPGMKGAVAVIEELEETTVYMVDYTSKTGEEVKNHKWVTEEELQPMD